MFARYVLKFLTCAPSQWLQRLRLRLNYGQWPLPPEQHHAILRAVVHSKGSYLALQAAEDRVRKGIAAFAKVSSYVRDQYFKKLQRFSKSAVAVEDDDRNAHRGKDKINAEEYPQHVNSNLYAVLRSHSLCTCSTGTSSRKRHYARLRLKDDIVKVDGCIAFDMLFSGSPTAWDHWQDLELRVAMRKKAKKSVNYWGGDGCPSNLAKGANGHAGQRSRVVPPDSFCNLVKTRLGSRICCHVQDSELHQLYDGFPLSQKIDPGPSLSLRRVLETGRLSNRMKLVLAYIVARSFWQYYDSPWMESQWTSDSIHFLRESPADDDATEGGLYASRPYFAVEFDGDEANDQTVEYCSAFGVIFRYPRLLALCIILLEIGRGQTLAIEDHGSVEANLNETWTLSKRLADRSNAWGDFDYPDYRKAILGCLDPKPSSDESVETDVFARKAAIYGAVVQPLHRLLNVLGFTENLHILSPIDASNGPGQVLDMPTAPSLPTTEREIGSSTQWLGGLDRINEFIKGCSKALPSDRRRGIKNVRVAILDTGFDNEASFFDAPVRRRRIKGWKDWAENSGVPVDENGHGTHTVSLLMKVAPTADIYVARVVKDRGSLKHATDAIAEVWPRH